MISEEKRAILAITSHVLAYPDDTLFEERSKVSGWVAQWICSDVTRQSLSKALDDLFSLPLKKLQSIYVDTFDWKEKTGLYLSAHEYGDHRKRGAVLVKLQKMVNDAGFEREDGELADYMPMLYELIAVNEKDSLKYEDLQKRLSFATFRVMETLDQGHPYYPFFSILMNDVFIIPTEEEMKTFSEGREDPDLDEMPYPMMYQ